MPRSHRLAIHGHVDLKTLGEWLSQARLKVYILSVAVFLVLSFISKSSVNSTSFQLLRYTLTFPCIHTQYVSLPPVVVQSPIANNA
jgi:hypothetical protein